MTDSNVYAEKDLSTVKRWLRKMVLGKLVFNYCSGFLCSGSRNAALYKAYDVPDEKLFPFAFSGGYQAIIDQVLDLKLSQTDIRRYLGLPLESFIVLYCGRFSEEKNPIQLLEAYNQLDDPKKALVFVGDGVLKKRLQDFVTEFDVDAVHFMGFQNRHEVIKFFLAADVLVLPSKRETWGMVVNEAMCCGLPIIVSDAAGASEDMVVQGCNGFSYPSQDTEGLLQKINILSEMSKENRAKMGAKSLDIISEWANRDLGLILANALDTIYASE